MRRKYYKVVKVQKISPNGLFIVKGKFIVVVAVVKTRMRMLQVGNAAVASYCWYWYCLCWCWTAAGHGTVTVIVITRQGHEVVVLAVPAAAAVIEVD